MLTVAAVVNSEEDVQDRDEGGEIVLPSERNEAEEAAQRRSALKAAQEMRANLSVGGKPDATTVRSQVTILCSDFELYAKNGQTPSPFPNELLNKGWSQLIRCAPAVNTAVDFAETQRVFQELINNLAQMLQEQRSMATIHVHLCLQAIVLENLAVPLHESSAQARDSMEALLKDVYRKYFDLIIDMVSRPPIVMINHDKHFFAAAHKTLERRQEFPGYDAVGAQLRLRGWIVVQGGAIYEKQLLCEQMIAACFLNSEQLDTWQTMLHRKVVNVKRFREICVDFTELHFSPTVNLNAWVSRDRRRAIEEENRRNDVLE
ncbi:unnamed protein product [Symbiodinium sp. CCMP2456]|nr:unnamed protein product [Symbiodinium sp. CCMP2456]